MEIVIILLEHSFTFLGKTRTLDRLLHPGAHTELIITFYLLTAQGMVLMYVTYSMFHKITLAN